MIPLGLLFMVPGNSYLVSALIASTTQKLPVSEDSVHFVQTLMLHLGCAVFGVVFFMMYLWNLPSVAKKMSKKFAKHRAKVNQVKLTTAETYLEVYLISVKRENERRIKTLRNDQPLDNLGLQQWFHLTLSLLPFLPCFLLGPWLLVPWLTALLVDTMSGLQVLRFFFRMMLGTNSLLKVEDSGLEFRLKVEPPVVAIAECPDPEPVPEVPASP
jgi:hypothetical protein